MAPPPELIRALDDEVRGSLQSLHDSYFHQLVVYGILVAVGIVFELPEIIKDMREAFTNWRPVKSLEQIIAVVGLLGWLMVAGGVAGETICEALVFNADTLIQTFDSGLLTDAQKQTAFALDDAESAKALANGYQAQIADDDARVRVAEAQVATAMARSDEAVAQVRTADARIAEAQTDAAEANRGTAEARLELARLTTPRTVRNPGNITDALLPFAGTDFITEVNPVPEAIGLLESIGGALINAHWNPLKIDRFGVPAISWGTTGTTAPVWYRQGLTVAVRLPTIAVSQNLPAEAIALANALESQGLGPIGREAIPPGNADLAYIPYGAVVLIVGSKP